MVGPKPSILVRTVHRAGGIDFSMRDLDWFRAEALTRGVRIAREMKSALDVLEPLARWADDGGKTKLDLSSWHMIDAAGTAALICATRRIQERNPRLAPYLWKMLKSESRLALPTKRTEERDKMWEIVVAGACSGIFDDVRL